MMNETQILESRMEAEMCVRNAKQQRQIDTLIKEVVLMRERCDELAEDLVESNEKIKSLQAHVDDLETDVDSLQSDVDSLQSDVDKLQNP